MLRHICFSVKWLLCRSHSRSSSQPCRSDHVPGQHHGRQSAFTAHCSSQWPRSTSYRSTSGPRTTITISSPRSWSCTRNCSSHSYRGTPNVIPDHLEDLLIYHSPRSTPYSSLLGSLCTRSTQRRSTPHFPLRQVWDHTSIPRSFRIPLNPPSRSTFYGSGSPSRAGG